MTLRINSASGVPLYLQLVEQIKHAIESGVMRPGDQLPSVRKMAEDLLINPNTVARAYRDLEQEGVIELKHGSGAFIRETIVPRAKLISKAQAIIHSALDQIASMDLTEDEIRRVVENELAAPRKPKSSRRKYA